MSLKLIYFKMGALAEAPQMLMRCYDIPYEYQMSWDYFGKSWEQVKSEIPFKQLPLLVLDDTHYIAQSSSIMRYIENIANS